MTVLVMLPQLLFRRFNIVKQDEVRQMHLQMASELRFPMGATTPLSEQSLDDFLALISRVSGPQSRKYILELFKKNFCHASRCSYSPSSSLDWAESDMVSRAQDAANDAPSFIEAVYNSLTQLAQLDATVPTVNHINQILRKNQDPFEINGNELTRTVGGVPVPAPCESTSTTVIRALEDAKTLIGTLDSSSAIDRAHTALHGYLKTLCSDAQIDLPNNPSASTAFKALRKDHPALQASGHRAEDITRVLNAFAVSIDAFSTLRNNASLAHVNELLDVPEATAIVNAMFTVFTYVQDSMRRAIS